MCLCVCFVWCVCGIDMYSATHVPVFTLKSVSMCSPCAHCSHPTRQVHFECSICIIIYCVATIRLQHCPCVYYNPHDIVYIVHPQCMLIGYIVYTPLNEVFVLIHAFSGNGIGLFIGQIKAH